MAELGLIALEDRRLQALMDDAVSSICRTLEVEYAKIDELLPGGQQLRVSAGAGWRGGVVGQYVMRAGFGSPAGYALLTGEPVIVSDMTAETRFAVPRLLRQHQVMSAITVVIDPRGNPFRTLAAMSRKRRTFSEDDVSFMQSIANVLAIAAQRAETERALEAARDAERSRIARDLHDEALRELSDALALAAIARSSATGTEAAEPWAAMITMLTHAAQQVRGAIYDISLSTEAHRAFPDLLRDLVQIHAGMARGCQIELHGAEALPPAPLGRRGTELLRIVGEALRNARRHSGATTVSVDAGASSASMLRLEVSDDGVPRSRDARLPPGRGAGIAGMLARADTLGAELQIESRPGGGTRVCLELELRPV